MEKKKKIKKWILISIFFIASVVALLFPYNCLNGNNLLGFFFINVKTDMLSYGELGNYVGGILGTVIAGITCYLVYKTYTRQSETAEKQQFETTFFNLIRIHKDDLKSIQQIDTETIFPNPLKESIEKRFEKGPIPKEYKDVVWRQNLHGAEALQCKYDSQTDKTNLFLEYQQSMWYNGIYMILKYLNDEHKDCDSFYTKYLAKQITKPEWWFLYGIFQIEKKRISDTNKPDSYVELAKKLQLFDSALSYIKEQNGAITIETLYEENEFPFHVKS